ncbi:MAG: hypothetical protein WAL50_02245 [Kineosporiaceae bacterium]
MFCSALDVANALHTWAGFKGPSCGVLLDLALTAGLDSADLMELGTIILARPEKAQKSRLLAELARCSSGVREPLLLLAADSDGAALARTARSYIGA